MDILVAVDGSEPSEEAVKYACDHFSDVTLTLLYVIDPMVDYSRHRAYPGYTQDDEFTNEREKGEAVLDSLLEDVPDDVSVDTALEAGDPARTIVQYADEHEVEGIVLGSHSRTGIARYLLGSVAETVVRRSPVPVTVVRPQFDEDD